MIDLRYYLSLLNENEAHLVTKYYIFKKFKNLNAAQWFFKNQTVDKITNVDNKQLLSNICRKFGDLLNTEQLDFQAKKELVLANLDKDSSQLSFLEPKGIRSVTIICPRCKGYSETSKKPERGWIPKQGTAKGVICQHRSSCGFSGDFIAAYAEEYNLSYGKALNLLADELGIDFTINEVHLDGSKFIKRDKVKLVPKEVKQIPEKPQELLC